MEKRYRMNLLLDFYGALLTDHAREMLRLRLEEDMSLQEVADLFGVSRQAVHDSVTRSEKQLCDYEDRLKLADRFISMNAKIAECEQRLVEAREALGRAEEIIRELE